MTSTPIPVGTALDRAQQLPRLGWEVFESTELRNAVVDPEIPNTDRGSQPTRQCDAFTGKSMNDGQSPTRPTHENNELDHQRITSMFQATRPGTSDLEVGFRASSAQTSRTSLRTSRPTTATTVSNVFNESVERPVGTVLTAIFSIDKISYDVNMFDDKITWTPISFADIKRPSSHSDGRDLTLVERGMVNIREICAVRLKNIRNAKSNTVTTIGFAIFTAQQRGEKLREHSTTFLCFSRDVCIEWASKIRAIVSARTERPKRVLTLSPQSIVSSQLWDDVIEERLQTVGIVGKFVEIHKTKSVSDYVEKILADQAMSQGPESYDGILVMSKVSFFAEVLSTVHNFKKEVLKSGTWHPALPTVGFLPVSFMSFVGKELHGVADAETAIFHSIYGCTQSVPLCSFYDRDGSFIKHGLMASYGFSGGDTAADTASKGFGTIQGSIRKGLAITRAIFQRRSYPCELRYKDSPQNYEPYDDDEIFAEQEFSKFSVVNEHYVDDDEASDNNPTLQQPTSDADSGVWPQFDDWGTVPRQNYLDITITSLPQHAENDDFESGCPLSAILVRETMSRKDLLLGMGSQVSMSSTMSKNKPEILDKTDIIRGSEFVIKPCGGSKTGASNSNSLSRWTIDDICIDPKVQELHVKVDECPILMYSRARGQPLSMTSSPQNVVELESNDAQTLDSSVA